MDAVTRITEAQRQRDAVSSELRSLPSELVTTDVSEADKVHGNDAPHIIKGLLRKMAKEEAQGFKVPAPAIVKSAAQLRFIALCHDCDNKLPLTQKAVDIIRAKILAELSCRLLTNRDATAHDFRVRHVWFPRYDRGDAAGASAIELHDGPEPLDSTRPAALKHFALTVDVCAWPAAVRADLESVGLGKHVDATTKWLNDVWRRLRLGLSARSPLVMPLSN